MLDHNKVLVLLIWIFSSVAIFGQNEAQYCFYKSNMISVKVTPPVHYYKDKDNYVKIVVSNLSGKYLYIGTNFVFGYANNAIFLDNTLDSGILESPLEIKRIRPDDSLKLNILLDTARIYGNITSHLFSLDIHLGYLFDIERYLKENPRGEDKNTVVVSSGVALMLMKRKYITCGYIELHK